MADEKMTDFENLLNKVLCDQEPDFARQALAMVAKRLMELEVTQLAGAARHERTVDRKDYRNGFRSRSWDTRAGSLTLAVPKLRKTPYVPCFLEARRRGEKALLNVVQEAYVLGVSTRKVDVLLKSMGLAGISKSEVSRICKDLDKMVQEFRERPLEGNHPYLWLDARYEKVRSRSRVVSQAVVAAYAVRETGEREVIGIDVGPSESEAFWKQFLRGLVQRGLSGVELVISDAHVGLKKAISEVLSGSTWQRCRVHFMRNMLAMVPKRAQSVVSATLKSIFAQPSQEAAREQAQKVGGMLEGHYPKVSHALSEATEEVISFMAFPSEHWRQIHSTNPLERLNREIKRRTAVVGIFPNQESLLRLVGALLIEQNDEWLVGKRYFSMRSMKLLRRSEEERAEAALPLLDSEIAA